MSLASSRSGAAAISELRFETRIGVGSRGQIFKAVTGDGTVVAVKVMNRDDDETTVEITALSRVQPHPNIVTMLSPPEYSTESAFLVLEFCDTDLLEIIMRSGSGLPEATAARYFIQLLKAVKHCHKRRVFHGDLKPENCLLKDDRIKLCDFGSASLHRRTTKAAGSVYYAAPEVLPLFYSHGEATPMVAGAGELLSALAPPSPAAPGTNPAYGAGPAIYDAAAADVWSLGVILFVALAGRPPFSEASLYDVEFAKLLEGSFEYPDHFPPTAINLLRRIFRIRPKERPSVSDLLKDAWCRVHIDSRRAMRALHKRMKQGAHAWDGSGEDDGHVGDGVGVGESSGDEAGGYPPGMITSASDTAGMAGDTTSGMSEGEGARPDRWPGVEGLKPLHRRLRRRGHAAGGRRSRRVGRADAAASVEGGYGTQGVTAAHRVGAASMLTGMGADAVSHAPHHHPHHHVHEGAYHTHAYNLAHGRVDAGGDGDAAVAAGSGGSRNTTATTAAAVPTPAGLTATLGLPSLRLPSGVPQYHDPTLSPMVLGDTSHDYTPDGSASSTLPPGPPQPHGGHGTTVTTMSTAGISIMGGDMPTPAGSSAASLPSPLAVGPTPPAAGPSITSTSGEHDGDVDGYDSYRARGTMLTPAMAHMSFGVDSGTLFGGPDGMSPFRHAVAGGSDGATMDEGASMVERVQAGPPMVATAMQDDGDGGGEGEDGTASISSASTATTSTGSMHSQIAPTQPLMVVPEGEDGAAQGGGEQGQGMETPVGPPPPLTLASSNSARSGDLGTGSGSGSAPLSLSIKVARPASMLDDEDMLSTVLGGQDVVGGGTSTSVATGFFTGVRSAPSGAASSYAAPSSQASLGGSVGAASSSEASPMQPPHAAHPSLTGLSSLRLAMRPAAGMGGLGGRDDGLPSSPPSRTMVQAPGAGGGRSASAGQFFIPTQSAAILAYQVRQQRLAAAQAGSGGGGYLSFGSGASPDASPAASNRSDAASQPRMPFVLGTPFSPAGGSVSTVGTPILPPPTSQGGGAGGMGLTLKLGGAGGGAPTMPPGLGCQTAKSLGAPDLLGGGDGRTHDSTMDGHGGDSAAVLTPLVSEASSGGDSLAYRVPDSGAPASRLSSHSPAESGSVSGSRASSRAPQSPVGSPTSAMPSLKIRVPGHVAITVPATLTLLPHTSITVPGGTPPPPSVAASTTTSVHTHHGMGGDDTMGMPAPLGGLRIARPGTYAMDTGATITTDSEAGSDTELASNPTTSHGVESGPVSGPLSHRSSGSTTGPTTSSGGSTLGPLPVPPFPRGGGGGGRGGVPPLSQSSRPPFALPKHLVATAGWASPSVTSGAASPSLTRQPSIAPAMAAGLRPLSRPVSMQRILPSSTLALPPINLASTTPVDPTALAASTASSGRSLARLDEVTAVAQPSEDTIAYTPTIGHQPLHAAPAAATGRSSMVEGGSGNAVMPGLLGTDAGPSGMEDVGGSSDAQSAQDAGPGYFHRVGTHARQMVEQLQSSRGIREGFQLQNVHLMPLNQLQHLHRRIVPKSAATHHAARGDAGGSGSGSGSGSGVGAGTGSGSGGDDDASSYYSADDAVDARPHHGQVERGGAGRSALMPWATARSSMPKYAAHLVNHASTGGSHVPTSIVPGGVYGITRSSSVQSVSSTEEAGSDMTSEYYFTDGDGSDGDSMLSSVMDDDGGSMMDDDGGSSMVSSEGEGGEGGEGGEEGEEGDDAGSLGSGRGGEIDWTTPRDEESALEAARRYMPTGFVGVKGKSTGSSASRVFNLGATGPVRGMTLLGDGGGSVPGTGGGVIGGGGHSVLGLGGEYGSGGGGGSGGLAGGGRGVSGSITGQGMGGVLFGGNGFAELTEQGFGSELAGAFTDGFVPGGGMSLDDGSGSCSSERSSYNMPSGFDSSSRSTSYPSAGEEEVEADVGATIRGEASDSSEAPPPSHMRRGGGGMGGSGMERRPSAQSGASDATGSSGAASGRSVPAAPAGMGREREATSFPSTAHGTSRGSDRPAPIVTASSAVTAHSASLSPDATPNSLTSTRSAPAIPSSTSSMAACMGLSIEVGGTKRVRSKHNHAGYSPAATCGPFNECEPSGASMGLLGITTLPHARSHTADSMTGRGHGGATDGGGSRGGGAPTLPPAVQAALLRSMRVSAGVPSPTPTSAPKPMPSPPLSSTDHRRPAPLCLSSTLHQRPDARATVAGGSGEEGGRKVSMDGTSSTSHGHPMEELTPGSGSGGASTTSSAHSGTTMHGSGGGDACHPHGTGSTNSQYATHVGRTYRARMNSQVSALEPSPMAGGSSGGSSSSGGGASECDDAMSSPAAVRPRMSRHPMGETTPTASPLPARVVAALNAMSMGAGGHADAGAGMERDETMEVADDIDAEVDGSSGIHSMHDVGAPAPRPGLGRGPGHLVD